MASGAGRCEMGSRLADMFGVSTSLCADASRPSVPLSERGLAFAAGDLGGGPQHYMSVLYVP